jgi:type I restriction-modification system DNA methylase subunit
MNLFLHGVGPDDDNREPPIRTDDALRDEPGDHFDVVVTNRPFGKKSSITVVNEEGETDRETLTYNRPDFWTTTSNEQLNFVQHVKSLLKIHGRAAVVVPDNVLFGRGRGRDRPAQALARVRRPHAAAVADGHLLRARDEGEHRLLRPEARREGAVDEEGLGL